MLVTFQVLHIRLGATIQDSAEYTTLCSLQKVLLYSVLLQDMQNSLKIYKTQTHSQF